MDFGQFPLASSLLRSDPFFAGSSFGDWPVSTMGRPRLGLGLGGLRGSGTLGRIPCDMYLKDDKYEYRFDVGGCGKSNFLLISTLISTIFHRCLFINLITPHIPPPQLKRTSTWLWKTTN